MSANPGKISMNWCGWLIYKQKKILKKLPIKDKKNQLREMTSADNVTCTI